MPLQDIRDSVECELEALQVNKAGLEDSIKQRSDRHDAETPNMAQTLHDEKARLHDINQRIAQLKDLQEIREKAGVVGHGDPGVEGQAASDTVTERAPRRSKK